jgi:hypothetical protein
MSHSETGPAVSFDHVSKHYGSLKAVDDGRGDQAAVLVQHERGGRGGQDPAVRDRGRLLADGTPAEIKARAGAKQLSFRLARVDEPFLLGLPGLVSLDVRNDVVHIQSSDSDATLYALLDAGYRPAEVEIGSLGLEQAFLAITAEDDRASAEPVAAN